MTQRNCLKCNKPFPSKGIFNRICERCNYENLNVTRIAKAHPDPKTSDHQLDVKRK